MDRTVFMRFEDFVEINTALLSVTKLALYRSESYEHPFVRIDKFDAAAWRDSGLRALALLIGDPANENKITGPKQPDVARESRVGFVNVRYGGEDEDAIGATWYGADSSEVEKIVHRELDKLLRKFAHKGVVDAKGKGTRILSNYFWTDAARASGKNWKLFLASGIEIFKNKNAGDLPQAG